MKNEGRIAALGFALLALIAVLPVVSVRLPPILDYPNHLARMHILAALPASADLARYYQAVWTPIPNLAWDAIVPALATIMPVEGAMRLMLALTLLALAGGAVALHRAAFRHWSVWPLFAFLLLYNRMLLWGFLNYLTGIALMLWALAASIVLERRTVGLRIAAGAVLATAIYFAHLAAFGAYALVVIAMALSAPADKIKHTVVALVTLLPGAILFLLAPTSGAESHIDYGNPFRKFDLPVSIFDNYSRIFDGATFGVLLIAGAVGLWWKRKIWVHPRLGWGLLALSAAYVALPSRLLSASGIDHRLPVAIAFLFVAASYWSDGVAPKWRGGIAAGLAILLLVRMGVIEAVWLKADRQYEALRPALDHIAAGATVAVAAPPGGVQAGGVPLFHFPTLAVLDRDAFVDTIFADPRQQSLLFTPLGAGLANQPRPETLWPALAKGTLPPLPGFTDLIVIDPPPGLDAAGLPGTVEFTAPRLLLIHLTAPGAPAGPEPAQ
ncbi:MAG TPA: hypothetical protein VH722_03420 [Alphaproteobacteria bacterium]|jgi:hypothetical protein|nr:hypothetical protein [Alphaproteobacteria bacterium]